MQKVLIIGATSAIAEASARIWAARGAALFLVGRREERLQAQSKQRADTGADDQPDDHRPQSLAQHQRGDVAARRTERHPHADLSRPSADKVSQDAIETRHREHNSQRRQSGDDRCGECVES